MMEKNREYVGVVEAFASQGEGIVKTEDVTVFIPFVLPQEKIRFKILKIKDNIAYGKCLEVLTPSPHRAKPLCPVFEKCGGCQLQHADYETQLEFKREQAQTTLKKIGNVLWEVPQTERAEKEYFYRNKLQLPIGVDGEGNTVIGFYAQRSHRIVPIQECFIHPDWAKALIAVLQEYITENKIKGYDEKNKTGLLRHAVVRDMGGKFIVAIVATKAKLPNASSLIEKLKGVFGEFTLVVNVNKTESNVIFSDEFVTLHGAGFVRAEEFGITFEVGAKTFVQINEDVRKKLYAKALQEVATTGEEVVIDCYSGAGLLTAMVAKQAKRAYGIEIEPQSSFCADQLKEKNGLLNMFNICGAVEDTIGDVLQKEKGEKVRLILDPPRAGIHRSVLKAIISSGIEKMVLISCNPATLARDLGLLTGGLQEADGQLVKGDGNGAYKIEFLQPYDMFPQTKHCEVLVVLQKNMF